MEFYQQYNQAVLAGQITPTAAPAKVLDLAAALLTAQLPKGLSGSIYGFSITNNDPTATLYVGSNSNVSTTNWWRRVPPNSSVDFTAGLGVLRGLYIVADVGTPLAHLEVFG